MNGAARPAGRLVVAVALAVALALPAAADAVAGPEGSVKLRTLSTRPDLVTGGDVLVALEVSGVDPSDLKVRRNGVDVTAGFAPSPGDPDRLIGLVDDLRAGANTIAAFGPGVARPARLNVYDSPAAGPLFSGARQWPFVCRTVDAGLGPAIAPECSAPARVDWYYRTDAGVFAPLADPTGPLPSDGIGTTTRDGRTVDYVVRVESGVIDRSIYRLATLAPGGDIDGGWNRRFVFSFGGGCGAGYQQGSRPIAAALMNPELAQGYATLTGSLNVFNTACNDVLSAEAAQMLKEHAIEELGAKPVWTMGQGGSGGSIQQQLIAQNYPGILDGIMPGASFPDASAPDYPDCRLLNAYFGTPAGAALGAAERRAITGMADPNGCLALGAGADVVNAGEGCDESVVPSAWIFDPVANPGGIRCTVWDSMINVFGRDPEAGRARRTLDNVGVQYGLRALRDGAITVRQFLDLNAGIGGFDDDGRLRPQRSVADPRALAAAYRTGRVDQAAGGYRGVPVLDIRQYVDDEVNVHQYVNTYRTRARLDALHGSHANQVMWRAAGADSVRAMNAAALDVLGRWMDAIAADRSGRTAAEKVVANRPAGAIDACWIGGVRADGVARIGAGNVCETTYRPHSLPADVAGRPLDSLTLKCRLKQIDYGDYGRAFTAAERGRLEAIFPGGVCDWSRPGVEQRWPAGTWQEFGPKREVEQRKRGVTLAIARRGRVGIARATLEPCPEVFAQPVVFESRARDGSWRRFDSGYAAGRRCRAAARFVPGRAGRHRVVRVRARAPALAGYRSARSRAKRP